jgi:replicative DNA helicase
LPASILNVEKKYPSLPYTELIIAKQRNGPVAEIPLTFLKTFEDRARHVTEPEEAF